MSKKSLLMLVLGLFIAAYLLIIPFSPALKFGRIMPLGQEILRCIASFGFDSKDALKSWEEKIFKGRVLYTVRVNNMQGYLNAYSRNAASGILYWLKFDPKKKPLVSWKWKVISFPQNTGVKPDKSGWIEKEDYAARFYIIFPKFPFFRMQCLEYVWDKDLAKGSILTNKSFGNLRIIVVESGAENLGKWAYVERNIDQDYKKVFGGRTPLAGAIAIMTDTDNTLSTAEAEYDEVRVGYEKE